MPDEGVWATSGRRTPLYQLQTQQIPPPPRHASHSRTSRPHGWHTTRLPTPTHLHPPHTARADHGLPRLHPTTLHHPPTLQRRNNPRPPRLHHRRCGPHNGPSPPPTTPSLLIFMFSVTVIISVSVNVSVMVMITVMVIVVGMVNVMDIVVFVCLLWCC